MPVLAPGPFCMVCVLAVKSMLWPGDHSML